MNKLTLWLSAAALLAASVAQAGDRHALVIGNQKYSHGALSNPDKDARDMAAHLKALGFEVDLVLDASLREMSDRAGAYVAKLHGGDTSFVFYSGHGVQVKGENFLIPVDFEATKESDVPFTAYPADRLIDGLNEQNLELSVIVLDACRDNPFKVSRSGSRGLTIMAAGNGTLIAFATGPGQTAADGTPGGNGVFTGALLKYVDQPGLDVETLFKRVREDVSAATARSQVPWSSSNVVGTFFLKPPTPGEKSSQASAAVVTPQPVAVATDAMVRPSALPMMPTLPSTEGLGLDADADVLVAYDAALKAEKNGTTDPATAKQAWTALAAMTDGNPYRGVAKQRAERWGEFEEKSKAAKAAKAADLAKLKKVLPLDSLPAAQKGRLVGNYLMTYGTDEWSDIAGLVPGEVLTAACGAVPALAGWKTTIHVDANYKGRVLLDGKAVAETPADISVGPCVHQKLGVSCLESGEWWEAPVTASQSGDWRTRSATFKSPRVFTAAGHEWGPPAENEMNWEAAKSYCSQLALDGGGWQLPDKDVLKALYDATLSSPELAKRPGMASGWYWSSTPSGGYAWYVHFNGGAVYTGYVSTSSYVRCVR